MISRRRVLNNPSSINGQCVLYVMGRDQRVKDNHALLAAQADANRRNLPLAVVFCLLPKTGHRAKQHYQWMLHGLKQVESDLDKFNIPFMLLVGSPFDRLSGLAHHISPASVYFDFSPLRGPIRLHKQFAEHVKCEVYEVDTHNIVPVWLASNKQEYAARTLRPKLHKLLPDYLIEPNKLEKHKINWPGLVRPIDDLKNIIDDVLAQTPSNGQDLQIPSGEKAALTQLTNFVNKGLSGYAERRNDPTIPGLSDLSPYLHFGQISSLRAMLEVEKSVTKMPSLGADAEAFIEELVVRKELSDNFCFYNGQYDSLAGAPDWARKTLAKHQSDRREFVYTKEQLEHAKTHDLAWNAAQNQLVKTGKMHGYMRMYWAKKVLEWTDSAQTAIDILIYLNDFYSLDGGDPNGYVGVLWSVAGLHDRLWFERSVFGSVRYMNDSGLRRKFDVEEYIRQNA